MMLDQLLYHVVPFRVVMATATAQSTVVKLARRTTGQDCRIYISVIFMVCLVGSIMNFNC